MVVILRLVKRLTGVTGGLSAGAGTVVDGVTYRAGTIGTLANATSNSTDATAVNGGTVTLTANENIVLNW